MKFIKLKDGNYLNIDSIEFIDVGTRKVYTISGENVYYNLSEDDMNILLDEINK